ncbi:uncharacterized protein J3R85_008956 [Psidium guajava]|nr:uncharacterized protein J3R85_008956 [Psidium guajava]
MAIKEGPPSKMRMMRLSTFIFHHTLHPWSKDRVLVWLVSRQITDLSHIRRIWHVNVHSISFIFVLGLKFLL